MTDAAGGPGSLAELAVLTAASRYVCPEPVREHLTRLLDPAGSTRVLVLHGPGGSGKTSALHEAARRAALAGRSLVHLDGSRLLEDGVVAADAVRDATGPGVLVLLDEVDALGAAAYGFGHALERLDADARVVVAGRSEGSAWLPPVLAPLVAHVRMPALSPAEAGEVLRRHGVTEAASRATIAAWAQGLPLALVLGAATWADDPRRALTPDARAVAADDVVDQMTDDVVDRLDLPLLRVAALAGALDRELVAAALPDRDPDEAMAALASYSVVERSGEVLTLHPLVARTVLDRPPDDQHRDLTLRVASHLRDRSARGDTRALHQLGGLIGDPEVRAGLVPAVSATLYVDDADASDVDDVAGWLPAPLAAATRPWLERPSGVAAPGTAQVVRHADGRPLAAALALGIGRAAALAASSEARAVLVAPLVEHAARHGLGSGVVVSPVQLVRAGAVDEDANVLPLLHSSALRRCGVANPRHDLVNEFGWTDVERQMVAAVGYTEIPALRREVGGHEVRSWLGDAGPGGLVGMLFRIVAAERGYPMGEPRSRGEVVLEALDHVDDDAALASLPLAPLGHRTAYAADAVRRTVRDVVTVALHDRPELAQLVEARYFSDCTNHDEAIARTYVSRATYFRRLREARARIAEAVEATAVPV